MTAERLQKILATAGVASRRAAEEMILEGRVTVNGTVVTELGTKADPAVDHVKVDGKRLRTPPAHRYILMNKPRGVVVTRDDPQHRPTVYVLLGTRVSEPVIPVGRLDFDSEGLLLLTNDGENRGTPPGWRPVRALLAASRSGSDRVARPAMMHAGLPW